MSSFIPSPKHFNSVETALKQLPQTDFCFPYSFKKPFPELYNRREFSQDAIDLVCVRIVDTLRELSAICVSLQYKHHYEGKLNQEIKEQIEILFNGKKTERAQHLNKIGLVKALNCINYQIETEHLIDLRELTENETNAMFFLKEMAAALNSDIVHRLPEYEDAKHEIA